MPDTTIMQASGHSDERMPSKRLGEAPWGMTAYWINTFTAVHDQAKLARYIELAGPAIRAADGVFLARGIPVHVLEGSAALRTTVIRFDSADAAVAAYHSRAYQEALAELGDGAERDIRILNGVED